MKTKKNVGYFLVPRVMVASEAYHDLKPEQNLFAVPTLCVVDTEDDTGYRGTYPGLPGMGNVRFPKGTTRPLTAKERKNVESMRLDNPPVFHPELFQVLPEGSKPGPIPGPRDFRLDPKAIRAFLRQYNPDFVDCSQDPNLSRVS